jgi:hypothetical protein
MTAAQDSDRRTAVYRRLKPSIDENYPKDTFVAIADDMIIATAASFESIVNAIRAQGRDPRQVLVIQAGVEYPEYVTIFM